MCGWPEKMTATVAAMANGERTHRRNQLGQYGPQFDLEKVQGVRGGQGELTMGKLGDEE